jgi:methionyl-tRNA synthetase
MRGIESQAMVLAASNADHTIVELLTPPTVRRAASKQHAAPARSRVHGAACGCGGWQECKVGERIMFSGHPGEPLPPNQIAKKKVWEAVAPHLGTNDECVAQYKGLAFDTTHGPCTVATIKSGGIK